MPEEADFFLGDVTMSWERQLGVEFSFLTLADSGAFVTHARRKLSEALALLRPFRWQVTQMSYLNSYIFIEKYKCVSP